MSKRFIATVVCVVVLCSCLIVPVFADSINGLDFSSQPIPVASSASVDSSWYELFNFNNGYHLYVASNSSDTYLFYFTQSNSVHTVYVNTNTFSVYSASLTSPSGSASTNSQVTYNSASELYYIDASGYSTSFTPIGIPRYSNLNDGLAAVKSVIDSASYINASTLDVPAGNVAYIKTDGAKILDLSTTFVQYSQLFSDTWANITQKVAWTNSLPSGTVTFPLAGMASLGWTKSGNTNVLGQTQAASASYQTVANQYFVIYNPLYQQYGQGNNYDMNGTIHVEGDMVDVKIYPLSGSVVTGEGLVSSSTSGYGDYFELQDDGNGGVEWVDQSGNVSIGPQTGGTSLLPQEVTIQSLASQILEIITKVGQSIANIFNVGHQAIVTLVGHATEFVSQFQNLYTWLPQDVFAVLSSAIILAITIGIIKVFI